MEALQHQLAAALSEGGADTMFGLIGGGNFGLAGSFRGLGGRYLGLRHEMNAVAAADSYARTTGRLGLATVTQGPGLTHTHAYSRGGLGPRRSPVQDDDAHLTGPIRQDVTVARAHVPEIDAAAIGKLLAEA